MLRFSVFLALAALSCGRTELVPPTSAVVDAGVAARCGDGITQDTEACDDGNLIETDACHSNCTAAKCGDGFIWVGTEQCDDGNVHDTDGCTKRCAPPSCGDGTIQGMETCDDGNLDPTDSCLNSCLVARCGDGFVRAGLERCDDGNQLQTDACLNSCTPATCGDGLIWAGVETCDDQNQSNTDRCVSCQAARCGDGFIETGVEQCDDANTVDTDACRATCEPARCGDGVVQAGVEACDDGNTDDDDACSNRCSVPVCGDGRRQGAEACDLGAMNGNIPAFLISQPSGTRIGTNPLVRGKTAIAFYDYRSASSHTGFEQLSESRIYLYVDSATGRLSLVLTHGIDDDTGQTQPQSMVNMTVTGLPTSVSIDVVDDSMTEFFRTSPTSAQGRWSFNQNSDGAVLGGFPFPGSWRVTVSAQFMAGITTWGWVRDDLMRIPLVMTEPITIEAFEQSSMCRPNCTIPRCGDGILDGGEVCDDGNTNGGDGCSSTCKALR